MFCRLIRFLTLAALIFVACSDDTLKKPSADLQIVKDMPPANADKAAADKGTPDKVVPDKAVADKPPPECPQHTNLADKVPCICFGQLVYNVAAQYPECKSPQEIHCCPGASAPKCETPE
jgi:hypothetical protein